MKKPRIAEKMHKATKAPMDMDGDYGHGPGPVSIIALRGPATSHGPGDEEVASGGDPASGETGMGASAIPEDFVGKKATRGDLRDAAVRKNMDSENYAAWQPEGDPYKYEFFAASEDYPDCVIAKGPDDEVYKLTLEDDPQVFSAILETYSPGDDDAAESNDGNDADADDADDEMSEKE